MSSIPVLIMEAEGADYGFQSKDSGPFARSYKGLEEDHIDLLLLAFWPPERVDFSAREVILRRASPLPCRG